MTAKPQGPMTIRDLVQESWEISESKGWHSFPYSTFPERLCLIHSEVSEALEDYRSSCGINEVYHEGDKPCGVAIELADILIRIGDLCRIYDVDIEEAIKIKHAYNRTRPLRHGGKKL